MLTSHNSGKEWQSVGYFQTFYCTEESKEKAKQLVYSYYLQNEENPADCKIKYDHVAWMRGVSKIEDLTRGYKSGLTTEMFSNRDIKGIWYSGDKQYYVSEEDYADSIKNEELSNNIENEYWDDEDEDLDGYDGECKGCDIYGQVDDIFLCKECAAKLDRDLIRSRDWDYSMSAFGLKDISREKLRKDIIKKYGKEYELIEQPNAKNKKKRKNQRKNKRKK